MNKLRPTCLLAAIAAAFALVSPKLAWSQDDGKIAVAINSDQGAEVVLAQSGFIAHAWEDKPGAASTQGWIKYNPGGDQVVMARDISGRLLIAWLSGGKLMVETEPFPRSGLSNPVTLISGQGLKDLRVATTPNGRIMLAAINNKGSLITERQQRQDSWEWQGADDIGGHSLKSLSVAALPDNRFVMVSVGGDKNLYIVAESAPIAGSPWQCCSFVAGKNLNEAVAGTNRNGALQVVALDKNKHLLSLITSAGGGGGWTSLSNLNVGNSVSLAHLGDGTLVAWGSNGDTFNDAGPGGSWVPGGPPKPGAWTLAPDKTFVTAAIESGTATETHEVEVPAVPPSSGSGPTCGLDGHDIETGETCVPPNPGSPAYTKEVTTHTKYYDIRIGRNTGTSILIYHKP